MNTFIKCTKCNYYHWSHEECAPLFVVVFEDERTEVRNHTFEGAARDFAKDYNEANDYCLMNEVIEVKVERNGVVKHFAVGAEPDVKYSVKEV